MADNYKTKHEKKAEGTPFTNGVFVGMLFGILVSIAVTLFITNGKSPFVSKDTAGACIEINSALGEEDVINIDEDTGFDFYDALPRDNSNYTNDSIQADPDQNRDVNYYLQVGAFSEVSPADNLKAKFKGIKPKKEKAAINKKVVSKGKDQNKKTQPRKVVKRRRKGANSCPGSKFNPKVNSDVSGSWQFCV